MAKEKINSTQQIKEAKESHKGFPKNIVHILKDPVNSSDDVKTRKKSILWLLGVCSCIFLITFVLSVVISDAKNVLTTICIIPFFGMIACCFLLVVLKKLAAKFADIECTNCKKRIAFDENVQFKVINKKFTVTKDNKTTQKDNVPVESAISAKGKERVTLVITCKCQGCGMENSFKHEFVTMECNKSATRIPYVQSGAMLVQFEADVKNAYASGSCNVRREINSKGVESIADNGVYVTYNRSPESLVKGYFGNEIQMR